jgi:hypothetical protein
MGGKRLRPKAVEFLKPLHPVSSKISNAIEKIPCHVCTAMRTAVQKKKDVRTSANLGAMARIGDVHATGMKLPRQVPGALQT